MDNRKYLHIPDNFAFVLRTGGGNLKNSEFKVSFAIAIGGITAIALIGHSHCGMVDLASKRSDFISGLVERAGWTREAAEEHFEHFAPKFEIENELKFVTEEALRIGKEYPKIFVAPLLYRVEDNLLYQLPNSHG